MMTCSFVIEADDAGITNFDIARKVMEITTAGGDYLDPRAVAEMILAECDARERKDE